MIYSNRLRWTDPIRDAWTLYGLSTDLHPDQAKFLFVKVVSLKHDPDSPNFSARYPNH